VFAVDCKALGADYNAHFDNRALGDLAGKNADKESCMPAEKVDLREVSIRQLLPWTEIFRSFHVALDPKKLLLAAAGLLIMAFGWWLLAVIFFSSREKPEWNSGKYERNREGWNRFKLDRYKWNLLYEAAGDDSDSKPDASDLADRWEDVPAINEQLRFSKSEITIGNETRPITPKPWGRLRMWPWSEDRGPNPYLLVTGQGPFLRADGTEGPYPWESGQFWDWLINHQFPVLIEPFVKFVLPLRFLLQPHAGFWNDIYFTLVLLWTLATWALFGGAITRMAVVQVARKEKITMAEALRFTTARYLSFFSAPLFPMIFVLAVVVFLIVFGLFHLIPIFGDIIVDGLGWPLVLLSGVAMAVVIVGLVGWPMMYATISAEGSDSFDALSRSYSYVYQNPWEYIWYQIVALVYGAIVVFFVGFMGSLMVYLGKWGVDQTPLLTWAGREPEYLFSYAPKSFGWQQLLMQGGGRPDPSTLTWYNRLGAIMVAAWLYLVFLMVVGFGYSFYWCVNTIIYLLMRRKVDDTELDEIYLEDEDIEEPYQSTAPAASAASGGAVTMVEAPTLKQPAGAVSPVKEGDGNPPSNPPA
jgi:hypothetical protein